MGGEVGEGRRISGGEAEKVTMNQCGETKRAKTPTMMENWIKSRLSRFHSFSLFSCRALLVGFAPPFRCLSSRPTE